MSTEVSRTGYYYDTGDVTLALGGSLSVAINNPANSGKKVVLENFGFMNQVSTLLMAYLYHQPTSTPTTPVNPVPFILDTTLASTQNSTAVVTQGATMSGGTQLAGMALQSANSSNFPAPPMTILPGVTLGLKVTAAVAGKIGITLMTREETI